MCYQNNIKNKDVVRKFVIEDFDKVMKIFDETDFGCKGDKEIYKPGRQAQMLMMREVLRGDSIDEKILVYDRNGKVIGYATIEENDKNWHIGEFAIDLPYRKQGIGSKFMSAIKLLAQKLNKRIILECFDKDNTFFIKQGFKKISEDELLISYIYESQRQVNKEKSMDDFEL